MEKICPFTRGNKFLDTPCLKNRCEWWREECGKCAVVSIAEIFAPIQERKGEDDDRIDYDSWELSFLKEGVEEDE